MPRNTNTPSPTRVRRRRRVPAPPAANPVPATGTIASSVLRAMPESLASLDRIFDGATPVMPPASMPTVAFERDVPASEPARNIAADPRQPSPWISAEQYEYRNNPDYGYRMERERMRSYHSLTVGRSFINAAQRDPAPVHKEKYIEVTVTNGDEFEQALANAIIPMLAKKIRRLEHKQPLPVLIKLENPDGISTPRVHITI